MQTAPVLFFLRCYFTLLQGLTSDLKMCIWNKELTAVKVLFSLDKWSARPKASKFKVFPGKPKKHNQDSRSLMWDLKPGYLKYEAGVVTTRRRRSVELIKNQNRPKDPRVISEKRRKLEILKHVVGFCVSKEHEGIKKCFVGRLWR